jgi:hypothetical protein
VNAQPSGAPVALSSHPAFPCRSRHRVEAAAQRDRDGVLRLSYAVHGGVEQVRVPAAAAPGFTDGLWRHTCFEAFLAADATSYFEFNFSPSGQWAIYRFDGYRQGMSPVRSATPPRIGLLREPALLRLDVSVELPAVDTALAGPALRAGLCAVIEDLDGGVSYWALAHPAQRPDFHHRGGLTLPLP